MIFLGFFLVFLMGFLIMLCFGKNYSLFEKVIFGMVLSLGLLPLLMFFLGLFKIPLTMSNILGSILIFDLLLSFVSCRRFGGFKVFREKPNLKMGKLGIFKFVFFIPIIFFIVSSFFINLYWPVFEWDALALYDFRALRFLETYSLAQAVLTSQLTSYNYSYPFFTSLIHDFVYLLSGRNPQFIYSIFYFLLLAVFYIFLSKKVSLPLASFFTACLATTPIFFLNSLIAYTNVAYVLYFVLATFLLWEFLTQKERTDSLLFSSVFLGFSTLVRASEPFWMVNIALMVFFCLKRKQIKWLIISLCLFIFLRESWALYRQYIFSNFVNDIGPGIRYYVDLKKIPLIINFLFQILFVGRKFLIFLFILTFFINIFRKKLNWSIFLSISGYFILIFLGIYILSINFGWWADIPDSARRTTMVLTPMMLYYVALIFSRYHLK